MSPLNRNSCEAQRKIETHCFYLGQLVISWIVFQQMRGSFCRYSWFSQYYAFLADFFMNICCTCADVCMCLAVSVCQCFQ